MHVILERTLIWVLLTSAVVKWSVVLYEKLKDLTKDHRMTMPEVGINWNFPKDLVFSSPENEIDQLMFVISSSNLAHCKMAKWKFQIIASEQIKCFTSGILFSSKTQFIQIVYTQIWLLWVQSFSVHFRHLLPHSFASWTF